MNAERFARIKEILLALDDVPTEKRSAYLDEVCGDDNTLRAEITALCEQDRSTIHDLLETGELARRFGAIGNTESRSEDLAPGDRDAGTPADAATTSDSSTGTRPRHIGPYVLRERIGAGGMGEVWRAEQTAPVRRTVALKLIRPGMDSAQVIARFEAERQALALMDHPYIAKVHDAGVTERGRPYFVMEYVPGIPVTDYCDQRRLDTRERLALFQRVCEGVQHAHQKAVIHRDIKPSNILVADVDGKPLPKIIDFGVAKATTQKLTEKTMYTAMGQIVGTPAYMSPEQAEMGSLDVDTRTDIYSLGAVLYELLTGSTPFDPAALRKAGLAGIQRIIREEEPPRPSTKASAAGEDTKTAAQRRRTDVRSLVRQLRGELDWITLRALEKNRTRRYETANALAQDIGRYLRHEIVEAGPPSRVYRLRKFVRRNRVTLGVISLVVVTIAGALVQSTIQRMRVEAARRESEAVTAFLVEMLESVDPVHGGPELTVREMLDGVSATIEERFADQARIKGQLRHTMGKTYQALGQTSIAATHMARAIELRSRTLGDEHPETLRSRSSMVDILQWSGRWDEAEALSREILSIRQRTLGDEHPETIEAMTLVVSSVFDDGDVEAGDEETRQLALEALDRSRRILGADAPQTLTAMEAVASMYHDLGQVGEAVELELEALDGRYHTLGPEHPETISTLFQAAYGCWQFGRYAESESLYVALVALASRVLGEEHPKTFYAKRLLSQLYHDRGRYEAAESLLVQLREHDLAVSNPDAALDARTCLSIVYASQGRFAKAEELLLECLERHGTPAGLYRVARSELRLADLYRQIGRFEEAESLYVNAYSSLERAGTDVWGYDLSRLAHLYHEWGQNEEAEHAFEEILARCEERGESEKNIAHHWAALADVYRDLGRHEEAEQHYTQALPVLRRTWGELNTTTLEASREFAVLRMRQGQYEEAERMLRELTAQIRESCPTSRIVGLFLRAHGDCLTALGRFAEAEIALLESTSLIEKYYRSGHRETSRAVASLVDLYESWGRSDEAAAWRARQTEDEISRP